MAVAVLWGGIAAIEFVKQGVAAYRHFSKDNAQEREGIVNKLEAVKELMQSTDPSHIPKQAHKMLQQHLEELKACVADLGSKTGEETLQKLNQSIDSYSGLLSLHLTKKLVSDGNPVLPCKFTNGTAKRFYLKYLAKLGVSVSTGKFSSALAFDLEDSWLPCFQNWVKAGLEGAIQGYVNIRELDSFFTLLTQAQGLRQDGVEVAHFAYLKDEQAKRYLGSLHGQLRHGYGIELTSDGRMYCGDWSQNAKEGNGFVEYADGRRLYGCFHQNILQNFKKLVLPEGTTYKGDLLDNGYRCGRGCLYSDKEKLLYDGTWDNDKRVEGVAWEQLPSNVLCEYKYSGGVKQQVGKYTWPDGTVYEGRLVKGLKAGEGKCTYPDGSQYSGQWLNDKRHGQGSYTIGSRMYTGTWENDMEHGEGTVTEGGILLMTGKWTSGKLNGRFSVYLQDGEVLDGGIWRKGEQVRPSRCLLF
jgi:hypothetical protein